MNTAALNIPPPPIFSFLPPPPIFYWYFFNIVVSPPGRTKRKLYDMYNTRTYISSLLITHHMRYEVNKVALNTYTMRESLNGGAHHANATI